MKTIEGTIYVECDLCWKTTTWYKSCPVCGHTVCFTCLVMKEKFRCPVCEGDFIEHYPK
ncbi:MAG: hypothetical protein P8Y18_02275 [Candidatus Bathyarchaeota archaeon]